MPYEARVVSAHRTPDEMFEYAETAAARGLRCIIAGAGGAAHLPGMLAAKTTCRCSACRCRASTCRAWIRCFRSCRCPRACRSRRSRSAKRAPPMPACSRWRCSPRTDPRSPRKLAAFRDSQQGRSASDAAAARRSRERRRDAMIEPGAWLGLLGGGQLGRMFTMAAQSMGYRVVVLDPGGHSPAGSVADAAYRCRLPRSRRPRHWPRAVPPSPPNSRTCRPRACATWRGTAWSARPPTASRSPRTGSPRSSSWLRPGSRSRRTRSSAATTTCARALRTCCPVSSSAAGWATTARAKSGSTRSEDLAAGLRAARERALRARAAPAARSCELSCVVARGSDATGRGLPGGREPACRRHPRREHRARARARRT